MIKSREIWTVSLTPLAILDGKCQVWLALREISRHLNYLGKGAKDMPTPCGT